jgi:crotonobetainyl-CoA:carnitine CoA-transferase CaiB-like acyl-CoA transferase
MDLRRLERAVALAGVELPADLEAEIIGAEPVLRSPHRLAEGAAVARLLTGVGANELWRVRTGTTQRLTVDLRHAAAALVSFLHTVVHDDARRPVRDLGGAMAQLTRIIPARDGRHVQLHASFNDAPIVLAELGLDPSATPDQVDAAVAGRDAFELEAALIERRVCGGAVRTRDEWADHPQGRALAGRPVVTITRIGDAPPEALPDGGRPATGVRVLDLTRVLAGPTVAKTLAEHGADVLHVSRPDLERGGPFELDTGIGKRQVWIDLDDPDDAEVLIELVEGCDVFSQGYRLGSLARRGLAPEQLAEARPGIVYVSENCYGPVGPWAQRPGWEQLAQAATGMSHREGLASTGGAPRLAPAAVNDYTTGWFGAYGAMMALARRATEGGSWHVEVSLAQTSSWYQALGDDNDVGAATGVGDVGPYLIERPTEAWGTISHLVPALSMSQTAPRWDLPPAPGGTHGPEWLPRGGVDQARSRT